MTDDDLPPIALRRATERDVDAIRAIVDAAYRGYVDLIGRHPMPMLADHARAVREHEVWVLDADGVIAGLIELIPRDGQLWVENVAIAPPWQGRGLGRRLLAHAESLARARGIPALGLQTNERFTANIAMYERYGYRETQREPVLGTAVVTFRKDLGPDDGWLRDRPAGRTVPG